MRLPRAVLAVVAVAVAFAAAACGSVYRVGSTPPPGGAARFVQAVRASGLGNANLAAMPSSTLVTLGQIACTVMSPVVGPPQYVYATTVNTILGTPSKPSVHQARVFVGAAVRDLCPVYRAQLPHGAP
jgi:hypothetical protein